MRVRTLKAPKFIAERGLRNLVWLLELAVIVLTERLLGIRRLGEGEEVLENKVGEGRAVTLISLSSPLGATDNAVLFRLRGDRCSMNFLLFVIFINTCGMGYC